MAAVLVCRNKKLPGVLLAALALQLLALQVSALHAEESVSCLDSMMEAGIDWEFIAYAEKAEITQGLLNPGNLIAGLPSKEELVEVRPDIRFECSAFTFALSPRFQASRQRVEDALTPEPDDDEVDTNEFVNAALLRLDIGTMWSLEVSRQALLWGPSLFFSPSNPFSRFNGRNTPYVELKGKDYVIARAFIGNSGVLSFYNNFAEGEVEYLAERFEHTYALAYEHTSYEWTATWLYSQRNSEQTLGGFGQYTLNDYVVLFTDISFARIDEDRLAETFPAGVQSGLLDIDNDWATGATLGGSYSFIDGSNVSAEYFYHESGLTEAQASDLMATGERASAQLDDGAFTQDFPADMALLGQVVAARQAALRQHYVAMQYNKNDIASRLDVVLRWTYGATDGGSLAVADFNTTVGEHGRVFLTLLGTFGDDNAEFRQFYDYRATLGASLTF